MFDLPDALAPGESRAYRYEVRVLRGGRWIVEGLSETASEAKDRARRFLAQGTCDEVKVLRHRLRGGGQSVSSEILHQRRGAGRKRPVKLTGDPARANHCRALGDFARWETRRFLATLLQDHCREHGLTPSEILFDWRHGRRLLD